MSARRRAARIGAWALVATGALHLLVVAAGAAVTASPAEQAARRTMAATPVAIAGIERDLWQLYLGFSLAMALFIIGLGALNLIVLRHEPPRAGILLTLAVVLGALALSVLLLPPPPIVLLTISGAAFAYASMPESRRPLRTGSPRTAAPSGRGR
ncbi:hypothetical protein AB0C07_08425 [Actinoplanes missouriensis]|uniref:LIC_13387 family protein n=1 Tax=Actinoplanes missouriensis TaxID=1866 RepID=UPI0033CF0EA0